MGRFRQRNIEAAMPKTNGHPFHLQVGKFRQRKYIEARKTLKGLMQVRGMHAVVAAGACAAGQQH